MRSSCVIVLLVACGGPVRVDLGAAPPGVVHRDSATRALEPTGTVSWAQGYGKPPGDAWAWSIAIDSADHLAVVGAFDGDAEIGRFPLGGANKPQSGTFRGLFVARLDDRGTPTAARAYGELGTLGDAVLAPAPDGDLIVAGSFTGTLDFGAGALDAAGKTAAFVARLAPTGIARWSKKYDGAIDQRILDVAVSRSGDIVIVGTFAGRTLDLGVGPMKGHDLSDVFVAALRGDGSTRWAKSYGDEWGQGAGAVAIDASTDIVVGGWLEGTMDLGAGPIGTPVDPQRGPLHRTAWIAKLDAGGRARWSRAFTSDEQSLVRDIAIARSGDVVVSGLLSKELRIGNLRVTGAGTTDGFLADFDSAGAPRWAVRAGTDEAPDLEQAGNIAIDRSGNVAVLGARTSGHRAGGPIYGSWLASFDARGDKRFVHWYPHALSEDDGHSLVVDRSGHAIAAGTFTSSIDLGTGALHGDARAVSIFLAAFAP